MSINIAKTEHELATIYTLTSGDGNDRYFWFELNEEAIVKTAIVDSKIETYDGYVSAKILTYSPKFVSLVQEVVGVPARQLIQQLYHSNDYWKAVNPRLRRNEAIDADRKKLKQEAEEQISDTEDLKEETVLALARQFVCGFNRDFRTAIRCTVFHRESYEDDPTVARSIAVEKEIRQQLEAQKSKTRSILGDAAFQEIKALDLPDSLRGSLHQAINDDTAFSRGRDRG